MTENIVLNRLSAVDVALTRMDIVARTVFIDYFDLRELIGHIDRAEPTYEPADADLRGVKVSLREGNTEDAVRYLDRWLDRVLRGVSWHGKSKTEVKGALMDLFPDPTPDPNGIAVWYEMLDLAADMLSGEAWHIDRRSVGDIIKAAHHMRVGRYRVEFGSVLRHAEGIYLERADEAAAAWDRILEYLADLMHAREASSRKWLANGILSGFDMLEKLEPSRLILPLSPVERAELYRKRCLLKTQT